MRQITLYLASVSAKRKVNTLDFSSSASPGGTIPHSAAFLKKETQGAVHHTLIRRYVVPYAFPKGADGSPDRTAIEAALPDLRNIFVVLDARLSGREYLAANRFTFADALLLATLNPALRRPEAAEISADAPAVCRYFGLHSRRRSFIDTAPVS